ncbi:MAG: flippase-like domain-containing protein [Deltaproteobacteria bacterium]|nr:flippase-like domain-containing protein [Deltaproteobacteria bacterium]
MIKSPGKMTLSLVLSILIWLLGVLSYAVFALGCPGIGIDLVEMAAVMVIVCIFIALPSVPGYWGLWEAGGIFALTLFGVSGREAAGFTLANHAIQMIPVMIIGAISAWITGVNIWRTSFT